MQIFINPCLLILSLGLSSMVLGAYDAHDFSGHPNKEIRYQKIIEEVRCPKCQNQNIGGSNAPISKDLRAKIYELLMQDKSDTEIYAYLVERYGDFVLYRPPVRKDTWALWFAPPLVLILVLIMLVKVQRSRLSQLSASDSASQANELDLQERERLKKIKANQL